MSVPTIRLARLDEAHLVSDLVAALIEELSDGSVIPDASTYRATAKRLLVGAVGYRALLAFDDDDAAVATLTLCPVAAIYAEGSFAQIAEFYVRPDHRGGGLGVRMVELAVEMARREGWTRLEVGAPHTPRWDRTVAFYRANGFEIIGPRLKRLL